MCPYQNHLSLDTAKVLTSKVLTPVQYCICILDMMGAGFNNCDIDRAIQNDCFTLWVMAAAAIIDFSKKELWTNVETTFNMLTAHFCNNNTFLLVYLKLQRHVNTFTQHQVSLNSFFFVNKQLDAQFFFMYVYYYSVHVLGSHVPIIRRINCINTTSGICHSV